MSDTREFDELFSRQSGRVLSLCYRMLNDRGEAEDACQEIFVKVYKGLQRFRADSSLQTWVHSIALNTCRDMLRQRSRRPQPTLVDIDRPDANRDTARTAVDRVAIDAALAELPAEQRETLLLCDLLGHSYEEIADLCGVPVGTVRSRIHRARTRMADLISPEVEPNGPDRSLKT